MATVEELNKYGLRISDWFRRLRSQRSSEFYRSAWQSIQPNLQWLHEQGKAGQDWKDWLVKTFVLPSEEPKPAPMPGPTISEDWQERRQAERRARERAEWLRRRQAPTQVLSNYPRLPQSTIPEPKVEYPAPGRPSKYRNPFAWRRPKSSWW